MIYKKIIYQGSEIVYNIQGKGQPVVLLHGFGFNNKIWNKLVENLKDKFMFILPDLPGSGESQPLKKENVSLSDFAHAINYLISEENIKLPVIIGHSMGGYITMAFEKLYPEISKAICLFHSSTYADDEEKIKSRKKAIEFINNYGTETFLNNSIPALFYNKEKSIEEINLFLNDAKTIPSQVIIEYYNAMINREDNRDVLKNYKKPILFIIGEHDTAITYKTSLEQTYIPNFSNVSILRDSAHMGMLEEPLKSSDIIHSFLIELSVK